MADGGLASGTPGSGCARVHESPNGSFAAQDMMREIRIADLDKRISSLLISAKRGCPACVDLLVLDTTGRVVASSRPAWIGQTTGTMPEVSSASQDFATIEDPLRMPGVAGRLIRFMVPVPDPDAQGPLLGRLIALIDWEQGTVGVARVRENLLSVDLNADVLILDARGVVIGGAARANGPWQVGDTIPTPPTNAKTGAAMGYIDAAADMLVGHAGLPDDLPPWTVVVAESLADAYAPAHRIVQLLAIVLAGTLLIAMAAALVAARRITRPLTELTKAAAAMGRGARPGFTVAVRSRDELGTLAGAFNRMAADLARAERELTDAAKFAFVGELAAGVAHEVRTPLGVMRSAAQLLGRSLTTQDEDSRELLHLLQDEVDRIERVVCALLELGRPHQMRPEPAPLGQIVWRAADFVEVQARRQGIVIRRQAINPDPIILCDPELIYQVVLNLLVNAAQILGSGGSIEIGLRPARAGCAGFEVRDDGPGMSEAVCARVFEPFFTRRAGGTGLGLTFVQRVVHEHRGQVTVQSAPGHGTVFCVSLPVAQGPG